jgi:hypothetical protein
MTDNNTPSKYEVDVFLFIFKHNAVVFEFAPEMNDNVYHFSYDIYNEVEGLKESDTLSGLFMDNMNRAIDLDKAIMVINYNAHFASIVKRIIDDIKREKIQHVFCLSFFHDDKITGNLRRKNRVSNMLDQKFSIIESMLDFPFIKKFDIPHNLCITEDYLTGILRELFW